MFMVLIVLGLFEIIPVLVLILGEFIFLVDTLLMYFKKIKQKFNILSFKENHLTIGNNPLIEIDYMKIQRIILKYRNTKDTSWINVSSRIGIAIPNTGQDNIIKIITQDGEKIVLNVWCENDTDYWRLRSLGTFFEKRGVNIKMKGFWRDYSQRPYWYDGA